MAIDVQDCGEMIKTAERMNRRLSVVKQNRFNPPVEALKQVIEEGAWEKYSVCSSAAFGIATRTIMPIPGKGVRT